MLIDRPALQISKYEAPLSDIYSLLYRLGAEATNLTFFYTSYAVFLCVHQPERLTLVTKWLYPDVARHYDTTCSAVERGIGRTVARIWETKPQELSLLAGEVLTEKLSPAEVLAVLTDAVLRGTGAPRF